MEPTLDIGQRVIVNRIGNRSATPAASATSSSSTRRRAPASDTCGARTSSEGQPCSAPTPERVERRTSSSAWSGGPATRIASPRRARGPQRRSCRRSRSSTPCGGGPDCNFPKAITVPPDHWFMMGDNRGALRRQPLLGPRPQELDHRRCVRHLLAPRPHRHPLTRRPSAPRPGASCSGSIASRATATWPGPTRPAAAVWPGRWSPLRCCSTTSVCRSRDVRSLAVAERLQAAHAGGARGAVPARHAGRHAGGDRVAVRARDRLPRPARDQRGRAARRPGSGRAPRDASASPTGSASPTSATTSAP